ncbi:MAG: hypothetical protein M3433_04465 [Actinomycetota bacterium]|nr:hypothetical protein [Actinomycetota bacterium]
MAYTTAEGRQELLDTLAEATSHIGAALESMGAAYEQLDEQAADRLEEELFGPAQKAYGRAQRVYSAFAGRHELTAGPFGPHSSGLPSIGARGFIDEAAAALAEAGAALVSLQESPPWTEVGDTELRAGVAEIRGLVDDLPERARGLVRTLGR